MQTKKIYSTILYLSLICLLTSGNVDEKTAWKKMDSIYESIIPPVFPNKEFNIINYYNPQDDTLYTNAINNAILDCNKNGGGSVIIPEGVYYTGPIYLKSNVNLHLSKGCILRFCTDYNQFSSVLTRIEGIDCYNISPLIYAYNEQNIAISGKGILDGQADQTNWFSQSRIQGFIAPNGKRITEKTLLYKMKEDSISVKERFFEKEKGMRPQFINLYKCKNILLEDFTINRSPFWLIHPLLSENITIRRVQCKSHGYNNDGCDPESCKNVLIEECMFDTGDDCIAIKSGRDEDGRKWDIPCENIIIRNCRMKDGHAGVAIGSEITGGCRNVWVENCYMSSPELDRIIRIKSNALRGGEVKNIYVRNIYVGECKQAILGVEMKYWHVNDGPYPPFFHHIYLENIISQKSQYALYLDGFSDKIQLQDIIIKNCIFNGISTPEINKITGAKNIQFKNVKINGQLFNL